MGLEVVLYPKYYRLGFFSSQLFLVRVFFIHSGFGLGFFFIQIIFGLVFSQYQSSRREPSPWGWPGCWERASTTSGSW